MNFIKLCKYSLIFLLLLAPQVLAQVEYQMGLEQSTIESLQSASKSFRMNRSRQRISMRIPTAEGVRDLLLEPHDIRSENYLAQRQTASGPVEDKFEISLFQGQVSGGKSSDRVGLSLMNGQLKGYFRLGSSIYRMKGSKILSVVESSAQELAAIAAKCGMDDMAELMAEASTEPPVVSATTRRAQIATDADFEFFQSLGSEANANAEILSILNAVDAIYQAQLGVTFSVTFQNTWTTVNDPYTTNNAITLLEELRAYWNTNFASSQTYDVAHVWTGKDIAGSTIGIAYLDVVCSSFRYGVSQFLNSSGADVALVAHELGHNFGANHVSCGGNDTWIMCPSLRSGATQFAASTLSTFNATLPTYTCLEDIDGDDGDSTNNPPVLESIGSRSVNEGSELSFVVSGSDPDGDSLSYSASPLPTGSTFSGQTFRYTPPADTVADGRESTDLQVTFTVTDADGLTDSEEVTITVTNINNPPTLDDPGTSSLSEGDLLQVTLRGTDPDGTALRYGARNIPAGAVLDVSSGRILWRPAGNQSGTYRIAVTVTDASGATANGTLTVQVSDDSSIDDNPSAHALGDFNGNGRAELSVYRPSTGEWFATEYGSSGPAQGVQFGLPGDVPLPADYNGDNITDRAVYRPSDNLWFITYSGTNHLDVLRFGLAGDLPVPADYSGDGRADIAIFRPAFGQYIYLNSADGFSNVVFSLGERGDIPTPADFDGDGTVDAAVWNTRTGMWTVRRSSDGEESSVQWGLAGDLPVAADYDGDSRAEYVVWRPTTGQWFFREGITEQFGLGGDIPVPFDVDGDGRDNIGVWRPADGRWYPLNLDSQQFGLPSDNVTLRESLYYALRNGFSGSGNAQTGRTRSAMLYGPGTLYFAAPGSLSSQALSAVSGSTILQGDYDGDASVDTAVFNAGLWTLYLASGQTQVRSWGLAGDRAVQGDFDSDGTTDLAIFRPSTGEWWIIRSSDSGLIYRQWGLVGDIPLPGDFNGDGNTDFAVWRPASGEWFVQDGRSGTILLVAQWGLAGDQPLLADFDRDGRSDLVIYRAAEGNWYTRLSGGGLLITQWGLAGDVPIPGAYLNASGSDFAVYRPSDGMLYIRSISGQAFFQSTGLGTGVQVVDALRIVN